MRVLVHRWGKSLLGRLTNGWHLEGHSIAPRVGSSSRVRGPLARRIALLIPLLLVCSGLADLTVASPAGASTVTVTTCSDSGAGSLRQAVIDAIAGDTIVFAPSPSCSLITLTSGDIEIAKNLTIDGPGAGALTVSGASLGAVSVFVVDNVTATISGLTIKDGGVNGGHSSGGGIGQFGHAHYHQQHGVGQPVQWRRRRDLQRVGHGHPHQQHGVGQHRR